MMRVADFITGFISDVLGVEDVFMVTGGGIMHLTDALCLNKKIRVVCPHHEQTAAMALEAYSRATGNFGVGIFTTGPGTTNAITGLVGAWQDSVPCLFISGQTKRRETVRNSGISGLRQYGVQEVDILPIVKPVTKYATMLNDPEDVRYELEKMAYIAKSGRPGPVWLDVPLDVQGALIEPSSLRPFSPCGMEPVKDMPTPEEFGSFEKLLRNATRPVIIAGHGIRIAKAVEEFRLFVEKFRMPVVTTYLGIDVLPSGHPLNMGRIGIKGTRAGNLALQNSDLVLSLGSSLAIGSVGFEPDLFAREAKRVVVDIDRTSHLKKTIRIDLYINSDAKAFIGSALKLVPPAFDATWVETCAKWKEKYPVCLDSYAALKERINIYYFIERLSRLLDGETVVSDAGSAYYAVSQGIKLREGQRYITSGALATMGYTLPAIIGVSAAKKRVVGITGDGSLQFNLQDLQTIVHYKFPVKLFVLNNEGYLSVRATQEKFFENRYLGEGPNTGVSFPDTKKIAYAYGIKFFRACKNSELDDAIAKALLYDGPAICEIMCLRDQQIIPNVPSIKREDGTMRSNPLEDMYPLLDRKEFLENMIVKPSREQA